MKAYIFIGILFFSVLKVNSQIPDVGTWRDHLPYQNGIKVIKIGSKLFCANPLTFFVFDTEDNSVEKLSKINGLSDVSIATCDYYKTMDVMVITYENGNIDLVQGKSVTNINDLRKKIFAGNKKANHIYFRDKYAYISYPFGILVVDLEKKEIKDTYNISENGANLNVYSLTTDNKYFYAATEKGIFKAGLNDPFLVNFTHWSREYSIPQPSGKFNHIITFNDRVIVNKSGNGLNSDTLYILQNNSYSKLPVAINASVKEMRAIDSSLLVTCHNNIYLLDTSFQIKANVSSYCSSFDLNPSSSLIDEDGNIWVADHLLGLMQKPVTGECSFTFPNGPYSNSIRNLKYVNDMLLVTAGGVEASWGPLSKNGELSTLKNETWSTVLNYSKRDFMVATADPADKTKVYVGTWNHGISVYRDNQFIDSFYIFNSSLQNIIPDVATVRVGGMTFDEDNNLWVTNSQVSSPISVRQTNGKWKSFDYMRYMMVLTVGDIHYDKFGQLWVVLPRSQGLFVFTVNGTIDDASDDDHAKFKPKDYFGEPIENVYCVTSDRDGNVWVGTSKGPIVYSNPPDVLNELTDGYQPTISRGDTSGLADALLGEASINTIAVDGANRKWFGTEKGGAYLFSADGTQELLHFDMDNSPLISNNVLSIAINDKTGEVYFGTDMGIVSYRSNATQPLDDLTRAYAFPNPVRPEYTGDIMITKLVENTSVKITDISGNLVYHTKSLGGQAVWDGKNKKGQKVASGVYLIFLTNEDGSATKVIKLLVIK